MERLLSDEGIETRTLTVSHCRLQWVSPNGRADPPTDAYEYPWNEENSYQNINNPWGLVGYVDALQRVLDSWDADESDHRMRYWVETLTVEP